MSATVAAKTVHSAPQGRVKAALESLNAWSVATKALAVWGLLGIANTIMVTPGALLASGAAESSDYQAFHRAGRWVWSSHATPLYPLTSFAGYQGPLADTHLCMNPPHFILLFSALSKLPLRTGYLLYAACNIASLFWLLRVLFRSMKTWSVSHRWCGLLLALGCPFLAAAIVQGTVSIPIALALAIIVSRDLEGKVLRPTCSPTELTRPALEANELPNGRHIADRVEVMLQSTYWRGAIVPGICLGFVSMKPQYLILVTVFLLARGHWRVVVIGAVVTFAMIGASIATMGLAPWKTYPRYLAIFTDQLDTFNFSDHATYWVAEQMINVRGLLVRILGFSHAGLINALSASVLILAIFAVGVVGYRVRAARLHTQAGWALVLALTLTSAGHANHPDGMLLLVPAVLAWGSIRGRWIRAGFVLCLPLLSFAIPTSVGTENKGALPTGALVIVAATLVAIVASLILSGRSPMRRQVGDNPRSRKVSPPWA